MASAPKQKNPRVPVFNPAAQNTANLLNKIIDEKGENAWLAYAALTRLSVIWAQPNVPVKITADYYESTGRIDISKNSQIIQDFVIIMSKLFPSGEGLPEQEGCTPL